MQCTENFFVKPSKKAVEKKKWKKITKLIAKCYVLTRKHNKTRLNLIDNFQYY